MSFKLALIQTDLQWQAPAHNRAHLAGLVEAAGGADICLLPEMFTTGFMPDPVGVAEHEGAETAAWMSDLARRTGGAVAGSIAVESGGRYFNRFHFATPDGRLYRYDKRHLFTMGGEREHYTAGKERLIVEYNGLRIMPLICYDLRFPAWSRCAGECDLILYTASWASARIEAWEMLLRARAIENQCFVAGVNRVGADPSTSYCGHSVIVDYCGRTLVAADDGRTTIVAGISRTELDAFRERFPAWMDGDRFRVEV